MIRFIRFGFVMAFVATLAGCSRTAAPADIEDTPTRYGGPVVDGYQLRFADDGSIWSDGSVKKVGTAQYEVIIPKRGKPEEIATRSTGLCAGQSICKVTGRLTTSGPVAMMIERRPPVNEPAKFDCTLFPKAKPNCL